MKKILFLLLAILVFLASGSVFATNSYYPDYEIVGTDSFRAVGLPILSPANPTDYLQNLIDITFVDGKMVRTAYGYEETVNESTEAWENNIELELLYDRNKLENEELYFINGTFVYNFSSPDNSYEVNGFVQGLIIDLNTESNIFDFGNLENSNFALLLECYGENQNWVESFVLMSIESDDKIILQPDNTSSIDSSGITSDSSGDYFDSYGAVDNSDEEFFYHYHEERPHIPSPSKARDVAAGVGVSTVGIVVLNSLTNTTVFGSAPFNGSFNPSASPSVQPGAGSGATSGNVASAQGAASASIQSSASTMTQAGNASISGSGNFVKLVGDFFKNLWETMRDMLTDEGRAYASGKMTDILAETDLSDISEHD